MFSSYKEMKNLLKRNNARLNLVIERKKTCDFVFSTVAPSLASENKFISSICKKIIQLKHVFGRC